MTASTPEEEEHQLLEAVDRDVRGRFADQMVPGITLDPIKAEKSGEAGLAGTAAVCRVVER